jgi:hypothetical protein
MENFKTEPPVRGLLGHDLLVRGLLVHEPSMNRL